MQFSEELFLQNLSHWLNEDIGAGDFSSLASIDKAAIGHSTMLLKANGVIAGIKIAQLVLKYVDKDLIFKPYVKDGEYCESGRVLAEASGSIQSLLKAERLMLNLVQHLSGIATQTKMFVDEVKGTNCKILDTRKTTPGLRDLEKWAVFIGGGENHRMGLYDMIMLKDNHVDSAGGITSAVNKTRDFLKANNQDLKIEVETRNMSEVKEALGLKVDRIMLDNFSPEGCKVACALINNEVETEASGGINIHNVKEYAISGVNYISVGALTHSVNALDVSFKTKLQA